MHNNRFHIEEESLIIQDSGEIPEVAYHSSLKYLTQDSDGPGLNLSDEEIHKLKNAVIQGYMRIIMRDLNPDNRDKAIYRGLARCIANWSRMKKFCQRENIDTNLFTPKISRHLVTFLEIEINDIENGNQPCSINCKKNELLEFAMELGLDKEMIAKKLEKII